MPNARQTHPAERNPMTLLAALFDPGYEEALDPLLLVWTVLFMALMLAVGCGYAAIEKFFKK